MKAAKRDVLTLREIDDGAFHRALMREGGPGYTNLKKAVKNHRSFRPSKAHRRFVGRVKLDYLT